MHASLVNLETRLGDVQTTLGDVQATQVGVQATVEQLLAGQARLELLHHINSHNSLARVSNSHAKQGLSTLTPLQSEAEEHVSSHCQKP